MSKRRVVLAISISLVILVAFLVLKMTTRQTTIPTDAPFSMSLERTACFGFCPIYRVTVDHDGKVRYVGEKFVAIEGVRTSQISQEQVRRLVRLIERIDFFSLADEYTERGATDMPSAITTLRLGGREKEIVHYQGDSSAPESLSDLEQMIDEITNTAQWINPTAP